MLNKRIASLPLVALGLAGLGLAASPARAVGITIYQDNFVGTAGSSLSGNTTKPIDLYVGTYTVQNGTAVYGATGSGTADLSNPGYPGAEASLPFNISSTTGPDLAQYSYYTLSATITPSTANVGGPSWDALGFGAGAGANGGPFNNDAPWTLVRSNGQYESYYGNALNGNAIAQGTIANFTTGGSLNLVYNKTTKTYNASYSDTAGTTSLGTYTYSTGPAITSVYMADFGATGANPGVFSNFNASAAPEPSQVGMLALMGLGLGGLILKARKRPAAGLQAA